MAKYVTDGVRGPPIQGSEQSSLSDSVAVSVGCAFRVGAQGTCGVPGRLGAEQKVARGPLRALVITPQQSYRKNGYSRLQVSPRAGRGVACGGLCFWCFAGRPAFCSAQVAYIRLTFCDSELKCTATRGSTPERSCVVFDRTGLLHCIMGAGRATETRPNMSVRALRPASESTWNPAHGPPGWSCQVDVPFDQASR